MFDELEYCVKLRRGASRQLRLDVMQDAARELDTRHVDSLHIRIHQARLHATVCLCPSRYTVKPHASVCQRCVIKQSRVHMGRVIDPRCSDHERVKSHKPILQVKFQNICVMLRKFCDFGLIISLFNAQFNFKSN